MKPSSFSTPLAWFAMKTARCTRSSREETYRRAFEQFTNGRAFAWKERWPEGPFLALYGDNVYQIESTDDLNERAHLMLTSTDEAGHVPPAIWIPMAKNVHQEAEFYARLLNRLVTSDEQKHLRLAFTLSATTSRPAESFWSALYHLDATGLYAKALVAAAQVRGVETLLPALTDELVNNGQTLLNQAGDGVFERLILEGGTATRDTLFYVFTVDPATWEVDVLV